MFYLLLGFGLIIALNINIVNLQIFIEWFVRNNKYASYFCNGPRGFSKWEVFIQYYSDAKGSLFDCLVYVLWKVRKVKYWDCTVEDIQKYKI